MKIEKHRSTSVSVSPTFSRAASGVGLGHAHLSMLEEDSVVLLSVQFKLPTLFACFETDSCSQLLDLLQCTPIFVG